MCIRDSTPNSRTALTPKTIADARPDVVGASAISTIDAATTRGAMPAWIQPRSLGLISLIGDSMVLRCWVISPPFVVIGILRLGWVLVCGSPCCTYGTVGYPLSGLR